jgi:Cdc6-like AAA superfamily ATPase
VDVKNGCENSPIIGRHEEFNFILHDVILDACYRRKGASLFVNGKSGVGKTYTLNSVLHTIQHTRAYKASLHRIIYVNAKTMNGPRDLMTYINDEHFPRVNGPDELIHAI